MSDKMHVCGSHGVHVAVPCQVTSSKIFVHACIYRFEERPISMFERLVRHITWCIWELLGESYSAAALCIWAVPIFSHDKRVI